MPDYWLDKENKFKRPSTVNGSFLGQSDNDLSDGRKPPNLFIRQLSLTYVEDSEVYLCNLNQTHRQKPSSLLILVLEKTFHNNRYIPQKLIWKCNSI